jgi:hypothetical protein
MDKTLKRVEEMESCLDECTQINAELSLMLQKLEEAKEDMTKLFRYYGSEEWYEDRDSDLPAGTKAGVLSEDLVYDEIIKLRDNAFTMLESATDILKNRI